MITYIQSAQDNTASSAASLAVTFGSDTTSGNFIIIGIFSTTSSATNVSSITDTRVNTWTRIGGSAGQGLEMELWYAKNINAGAAHAITVNLTTNAQLFVMAREYSGVDLTSPIDTSNFGATGNSTTPTSGNIVTSFNSEVIIGFANIERAPVSWTVGSGYGNLTNKDDGGGFAIAMEDKNVSSSGSYSADFSSDMSGPWEMAVVGVKDASQPTTSTSSTSRSTSTSSTSTSSTSRSTSSTSRSTSSTSTSTSLSTSSSTSTSTTYIDYQFIPQVRIHTRL